jgi:signal recognition particle subunit SRP54
MHFFKQQRAKKLKRKPLVVSVDVTRPAAIEQLERLAVDAKIDNFKTNSMNPVQRAQEAVKYAQTYGLDFLIVDTAGRLSIDEALMKELEEIKKALNPQHLLYVADAMSGQQGVQVAEGFSSRVGLTGAVLSKTDGDSRGGIAFSIREALKVPLQFVGTGEKLEGFEVFHPDRWVSRILGLGDVLTLIE